MGAYIGAIGNWCQTLRGIRACKSIGSAVERLGCFVEDRLAAEG